jgi:hypothetical protein
VVVAAKKGSARPDSTLSGTDRRRLMSPDPIRPAPRGALPSLHNGRLSAPKFAYAAASVAATAEGDAAGRPTGGGRQLAASFSYKSGNLLGR